MDRIGQAEYMEYIMKLFIESKLSLEESEKKQFHQENHEDVYSKYSSSREVA